MAVPYNTGIFFMWKKKKNIVIIAISIPCTYISQRDKLRHARENQKGPGSLRISTLQNMQEAFSCKRWKPLEAKNMLLITTSI